MKTKIKQYLKENPCYLVAAIVLASEGDTEILKSIYGDEMAAFSALKIARVAEHHSKIYQPSDFPISLSRENEIIKIPERLAGFVFSGKDFYGVQCDAKPQALYGAEWLKQFSAKDQAKLLAKHAEITGAEVVPEKPSYHPAPTETSFVPSESPAPKKKSAL